MAEIKNSEVKQDEGFANYQCNENGPNNFRESFTKKTIQESKKNNKIATEHQL